ncbi:hypothetical protein [Haloferax larsenii]|uniref:hypothetical protein n=1 Tax=Haloferax larsenii TaxID=302484 RepID=UPI0009427759|nr:hypothetical protein [Haloferax larsenii]
MNEESRFAVAAALGLIISFLVFVPVLTPGPLRLENYLRLDVIAGLLVAWIFLVSIFGYSISKEEN